MLNAFLIRMYLTFKQKGKNMLIPRVVLNVVNSPMGISDLVVRADRIVGMARYVDGTVIVSVKVRSGMVCKHKVSNNFKELFDSVKEFGNTML